MNEFKSETRVTESGATVEVVTLTHNGVSYLALGAVVDAQRGRITGYVTMVDDPARRCGKRPVLTSHDGTTVIVEELVRVSTWKIRNGWVSSTMSSYRAIYQGEMYHGRGCGEGMHLTLHRAKKTS